MVTDISHLTSLFENATEGIVLTNGRGDIVLVNPAARRMFGYSEEEIVGKPIEILIPDEMKKTHKVQRDGFYQNPSNRVMGHGRDLFGRRKDGTDLPVEVSLSHYNRNEELFVIAFVVDITHRKVAEQNMLRQQEELARVSAEIRKLNAELEVKVEERTLILKEALHRLEQSQTELSDALDKERELNEIKSRFVSMASHEFRTPLSTVLSSAALLEKYKTTDEQDKRDRHITKIKSSVKHLNNILEDFLSLGKLDEGKVSVVATTFNLRDMIDELVEEIQGLLHPDQQVVIDFNAQATLHTDRNLLKNAVINILTNAIKFSPEDKPVFFNVTTEGDHTLIAIKDEGIGIPEEEQEHLFSSFFRARNASNIQGTGLGLNIVKRYLDLLGGSIHLESQLHKGTTVTIRIKNQQP